jgi:hypothetical protein
MSTVKAICDTKIQIIDDVNHVVKILYIGIISELERALQSEGIQSTMHLLWMNDADINNIEFKKGDAKLPVPIYQVASLRLFINYC